MKSILISIFISIQIFAYSQISLEKTYDGSAGLSQIKENVFRYYNYDTITNQCIIYNESHDQLYGIDLGLSSTQYLSTITYVSENLFDLDDQLELLFTFSEWEEIDTVWYLSYHSKVVNQAGELLLDMPGAQYNTITNTNTGSSLLAWIYDFSISSYPIETLVYHLPGDYSDIVEKIEGENTLAWPNPCTQSIYLPINERTEVIKIYNEQGLLIDELQSSNNSSEIKYQVNHLSSGVYFYQTISDKYQGKMNKFIIQ